MGSGRFSIRGPSAKRVSLKYSITEAEVPVSAMSDRCRREADVADHGANAEGRGSARPRRISPAVDWKTSLRPTCAKRVSCTRRRCRDRISLRCGRCLFSVLRALPLSFRASSFSPLVSRRRPLRRIPPASSPRSTPMAGRPRFGRSGSLVERRDKCCGLFSSSWRFIAGRPRRP